MASTSYNNRASNVPDWVREKQSGDIDANIAELNRNKNSATDKILNMFGGRDAVQDRVNTDKILNMFGGREATQGRINELSDIRSSQERSATDKILNMFGGAGEIDKRKLKSAEEAARSQAAAVSSADAQRRAAFDGDRSKNLAAKAMARAAQISSNDASKKQMDWNNSDDAKFKEWKKQYNKKYYESHRDQWRPGGKYYYDIQLARVSGSAKGSKGGDVIKSPINGELIDLSKMSKEARAAFKEWSSIYQRGQGKASASSDRDFRRMYEEYLHPNSNKMASQGRADGRAKGVLNAKRMLEKYGNLDTGSMPRFTDEVRNTVSNYGKTIKNLSANAVNTGKDFLNNLRRRISKG